MYKMPGECKLDRSWHAHCQAWGMVKINFKSSLQNFKFSQIEILYVVQVLKKLETMMHAVKQITKVHYYTKNLESIAALKKHKTVWMNFLYYVG